MKSEQEIADLQITLGSELIAEIDREVKAFFTYNGISVVDIYRCDFVDLPIPEDHRIVCFAPPLPRQLILSVLSRTVVKVTASFHELCPRIILEEIEPCELCGDREPITLTEIKKSAKAKHYSLMLLCAGCIETNKNLIKALDISSKSDRV